MYIPKLIFKTPAYTLGKHWPLRYVTAALLPSKMCEDEVRGMGSILESIHRWLWSYGLTVKTEGFQTLPTEFCKDVGEGNGKPLQYSCLENPVDRGAWWTAVHRVTQSWTWLKRLSMHACIGEGNGNPLQCSCLENPRDRGTWRAAVHRVAQSWTRLKQLSSSSRLRPHHLSRGKKMALRMRPIKIRKLSEPHDGC